MGRFGSEWTARALARMRGVARRARAGVGEAASSGGETPPAAGELDDLARLFATPERTARSAPVARRPTPPPVPDGAGGACLLSVCTRNHLHFARSLVESWRAHHPELPAYVVVADWDGDEPLDIEGAQALAGGEVAGADLPFMALKYSATDLCCALKPHGLRYLLERTAHDRIVYADADVCFFARATALFDRLERAAFVVTPHVLAPKPHPDRFWQRPTLGDLAYAGPLNAGLFGLRAGDESRRFVADWLRMVTGPGAFVPSQGGQMEQNSFNWVTYFVDGVAVLRDRAYNAAYWNLHERSLRCSSLDRPDQPRSWTVDGEPLVAFHFSGFSPRQPALLSKYDNHHPLYHLPSVALLCEHYLGRLAAHGAAELDRTPYRFDAFPSGIAIDGRMRRIFKEHETALRVELDPWTPAGESHYCRALLSPIAATGSLIPVLFDDIFEIRSDLQPLFARARTHPEGMLRWIAGHGADEHGYRELYDRHRPTRLNGEALPLLATARRRRPQAFEGLAAPFHDDRRTLLRRLEEGGLSQVAELVRFADLERYEVSPMWVVRRVFEQRPDLERAFPAPLTTDAGRFADWLREFGVRECRLPAAWADEFARRAGGGSLARIYSNLSRDWDFMERWPLALVGVGTTELARLLLAKSKHGLEYDLDDVVMLLWQTELEPWSGIPLTLELPVNARRHPSPLLEAGQEALLAPVLDGDPRFRHALERYRREHASELDALRVEAAQRIDRAAPEREVRVARAIERSLRERYLEPPESGAAEPCTPFPRVRPRLEPGVNLFGYHRSPIGLGSLTRGLGLAFEAAGIETRAITVGNDSMSPELRADDFVRRWHPRLETNLFLSYPHLHEMLLEAQPEHVVRDRRNIAYMAWEQRDGNPYWPLVLGGFDQVWALSSFAAGALERGLGRRVHAVSPVLELEALPPPVSKAAVGLDPERFVFLYVFDASSSIERKNPEAAIAAFARAFAPSEPVSLVLRVANAHRLDHRERLRRLAASAPPGARIELRLEPMDRARLLGLLSAADCYVSLHRAEGFGYTCAEAMAYGRPVVASGYSGNLDFMTPENSFLVRTGECTVEVPDGPFQRGSVWGEPSIDDAALRMREVYEHRARAAEIGRRAALEVREKLSATAIGARVRELLGYGGRRTSGDVSLAARAGS